MLLQQIRKAPTGETRVSKYKLRLPDGDTRKARVVWVEQQGDITELCIAVDGAETQAIRRSVAAIAVVGTIDGHDVIRRESALELIQRHE